MPTTKGRLDEVLSHFDNPGLMSDDLGPDIDNDGKPDAEWDTSWNYFFNGLAPYHNVEWLIEQEIGVKHENILLEDQNEVDTQ